jgi:hypothetical protein
VQDKPASVNLIELIVDLDRGQQLRPSDASRLCGTSP